jgi:hypothetical protein
MHHLNELVKPSASPGRVINGRPRDGESIMPANLNLKRFAPLIVIGVIFLLYVANGVNNFVMGMMDESFRSGPYEALAALPPVAPMAPKTTYVCTPAQKTPWIGCSIQ